MTVYVYKGLAADGTKSRGQVEASSAYGAKAQLAPYQFTQVHLREQKGILHAEITPKKVKPLEVMHFSRQLAAFIRAGVPIVDAIGVIAEETTNDRFRTVLAEVRDALRAGETFSSAMGANPDVFPRYYLEILASAELTGSLDSVLDQLAGYIERDEDGRRRITAALIYPGIVLAMSLVTVAVLAGFVLPRFKDFFKSFDATLPLPTRIMIALGDFVSNFWWAILAVAAIAGAYVFATLRTEVGKRRRDALVLRIPAVGDVVRFAVLERFCRILAAMTRSGVPLPDGLAVATGAAGNRVFQESLVGVRERMVNGEGLSEPLEATGLFPGVANQMVRVGEETGTLDQQLETAAEFYEIELEYKVKRLTTLFEPAVIVMVGLLVGFVAIALISAMYGIFNQVQVQ
ncbi:MAG: type II secretion system F family protein [Actinomycetota bacterium]